MLLALSTEAVRAENLLLRRQLALFLERGVQPRRVDAATRASLAVLARLFDWRSAPVVVPNLLTQSVNAQQHTDRDSPSPTQSQPMELMQMADGDGIRYSNVTLTLYRVQGGNTHFDSLSEDNF